jgi:hypothetical protein
MVPSISILDAAGIDALPPPVTDEERQRRSWVTALTRFGPRHFIDNANVTARGIVVNGNVLPLILADCVADNADVCSPYSHYIAYTLEEFAKRHRRLPSLLPRTLMLPLRAILKAGRLDRVVFVNNWLLPTNPGHGLAGEEVAELTGHLAAVYPDAAIVFRTLNRWLDSHSIAQMQKKGYRLVRSRRVYLVDTRNTRYLKHVNVRLDHRMLLRTPYQIEEDPEALAPHSARLAELYRGLYLHKHSWLNPHFNEKFFALTLTERVLTYRALVREGRIDGFIAFREGGGIITGHLLGYDRGVPIKDGLYRMLIAIFMVEAAKRGAVLNLSAGADRFKVLRGGLPVEEYDAVFDQHLAPSRRLAWTSLRIATDMWARARRAPSLASRTPRGSLGVNWDRTLEQRVDTAPKESVASIPGRSLRGMDARAGGKRAASH